MAKRSSPPGHRSCLRVYGFVCVSECVWVNYLKRDRERSLHEKKGQRVKAGPLLHLAIDWTWEVTKSLALHWLASPRYCPGCVLNGKISIAIFPPSYLQCVLFGPFLFFPSCPLLSCPNLPYTRYCASMSVTSCFRASILFSPDALWP